MSEYKSVPVAAAAAIAREYDKSIVIICAWDPAHCLLHTTTYGSTEEEKHWAAAGGVAAAKALEAVPQLGTQFEDFRTTKLQPLVDALREIGNRAGAPTMQYSPDHERKEQRESLDWIAKRVEEALS